MKDWQADKSSLASVSEQMEASQCLSHTSHNHAHFAFSSAGRLPGSDGHSEQSQDAKARAALDTQGE